MKIALIVAAVLLYLYLHFITLPSILSFFIIFGRRNPESFETKDLSGTPYEPYAGKFASAREYLSGRDKKELSVLSYDGVKLRGTYYKGTTDATVLCIHGFNSSPLNNFACHCARFLKEGFNVLLAEQRAHGGGGGKFTGLGLIEQNDVLVWIEKAKELDPDGSLVLYGISMGCTAMMYACDRFDQDYVRGAVFDCGFDCPYDQMRRDLRQRRLPASLMLPYSRFLSKTVLGIDLRKRTEDVLKTIRVPSLFLHGTGDPTVPVSVGRDNYEACATPKRMIEVPGAGHALSFIASSEARHMTIDFIREVCGLANNNTQGETP